MGKTQLLLIAMISISMLSYSQDSLSLSKEINYTSAFRIEKVRKLDCTIISYHLSEWNPTLTRRDDRNIGTFYYASGRDCQKCFEETFALLNYRNEEFLPVPNKTIVTDSFEQISIVTVSDIIASGCTKLFLTTLWGDHHTTVPRDDIYLGTDIIIDSAQPEEASTLDVSNFETESDGARRLLENFETRSYFKSREMIINRNLIIEKLRAQNRLKEVDSRLATHHSSLTP